MKIQKIKNKKADVSFGLSEVGKIVLAVICIVLLLFLAVKLYGLFFKKTALEQANEGIKTLSEEIQGVINGKAEGQVFLESPVGWQVIVWPNRLLNSKPDSCKAEYCICLCPIPSLVPEYGAMKAIDRAMKECNSVGVCRDFSQQVVTFDKYDVNNPLEMSKPSSFSINFKSGVVNVKQKA